MSSLPFERLQPRDHVGANAARTELPPWLKTAGLAVRAIFIVCLLAITIRVSLPQNETILTVYDTPGDVVRLLLGFGVCIWVAMQLFWAPEDEHGYRTWLYFGVAAIPFALICLVFVW